MATQRLRRNGKTKAIIETRRTGKGTPRQTPIDPHPFAVIPFGGPSAMGNVLSGALSAETNQGLTTLGHAHRGHLQTAATYSYPRGLAVTHIQMPRVTDTVLASTVREDAREEQVARKEGTHVACAEARDTPRKNAVQYPDLLPVITPFLAQRWKELLVEAGCFEEFKHIPYGIEFGFDMGVHTRLQQNYIPPNHASALNNPEAVEAHIAKEKAEKHYSGPFSASRLQALIGFFRTSPLGVVPKAGSANEFRIIQDLSFPRNDPKHESVNAEIDPEMFLCDWGTFSEVVLLVIDAPDGAEVATLDVDAAFRRCPIRPDQQHHFIVQWKDQFWIDHVVPFGAASSCGVFGQVADAMKAILAARGIKPCLKWVDDFLFMRIILRIASDGTVTYSYNLKDILDLAFELGWPWKESKTRPFSDTFKYLGLLWNLREKTVQIPDEKKAKYLEKIRAWVYGARFNRKESEGVLGTLVHCTLAVPDGRSHLPSISNFVSSLNHSSSQFAKRTPNKTVLDDIDWWRQALSSDFCGSKLFRPPEPAPIAFWVDASTSWGIGVVLDGIWDSWKLSEGWKSDGRDIGWAEMIAIECGLRLAIHRGMHSLHLVCRSDNQGVIHALSNGRSRSVQQNCALRRIVALMRTHSIWISSLYVPSASNIADAPSRDIPIANMPRSPDSFSIPNCLNNLLSVAIFRDK